MKNKLTDLVELYNIVSKFEYGMLDKYGKNILKEEDSDKYML